MVDPLTIGLGVVGAVAAFQKGKVRTWDANKVIVSFGPIVMSGFAPDSFLDIAYDGEPFVVRRGTGMEVERVKVGASNFVLTLNLLQTSPCNDLLSIAHIADITGNAGIYPFIVKDLNGTQSFVSIKAFIMSPASTKLGAGVSERQWKFYCPNAFSYVGGNNIFS